MHYIGNATKIKTSKEEWIMRKIIVIIIVAMISSFSYYGAVNEKILLLAHKKKIKMYKKHQKIL